MGVPAFFRWLSRKYPSVIVECIEQMPTDVDGVQVPVDSSAPNPNNIEFDNLYLDMNGIIHPCTHPEDKPAPKDEDEMMIAIFECIDRLFKIVRPRKVLYMAIDGVAPCAKMNQQRSRRFRASKETQEKIIEIARIRQELQEKGAQLPPEKSKENHFDLNCITPGTEFMDRLSRCLHYYIHDRLNNDPGWRGIKVILSDAKVPGEGEHKIMDYIRRQRAQPDHDPNTQHVLCGADADLIMLGLATHEPNFTIIREEFKPNKPRPCDICGQIGHEMKECIGRTPEEVVVPTNPEIAIRDQFIFVRLNVLREYLEKELQLPNLPFEYSFERALDDWVFMCFFVGNDFLPHLPSLEIREGAINRLVNLYKKTIYKTRGWLTDSGDVNLDSVQMIMSDLGQAEDEIFKKRQQTELMFKAKDKARKRREKMQQQRPNFNALDETQFAPMAVGAGAVGPVRDARREAFKTRLAGMQSDYTPNQGSQRSFHDKQQSNDDYNRRGFKRKADDADQTSKESNKNSDDEEDDQAHDEVRLWEDGFKERYYESKFDVSPENLEFRYNVALQYVRGLCWVLRYYYQGCASWKWYFPYHYAPFASDFVNIGGLSTQFEKGTTPIRPFEQLMSVFPAASGKLVPKSWATLMSDPESPIIDFYPEDFKIDLNGKKFAWQGVALLPFVEEKRLFKALESYYDHLTQVERMRNSHGDDRIYVSIGNPSYAFIKNLYLEVANGKMDMTHDTEVPYAFENIRGVIKVASDCIIEGGQVNSPIPGLPFITDNRVLCARYKDPTYPEDFIFPAIRLEGAINPPRILKPGDLSHEENRNWQPRIGMVQSNTRATLGDAGHRMMGHQLPMDRAYGSVPPPYAMQGSNYRGNNRGRYDGGNRGGRGGYSSGQGDYNRPDQKRPRYDNESHGGGGGGGSGYYNRNPSGPYRGEYGTGRSEYSREDRGGSYQSNRGRGGYSSNRGEGGYNSNNNRGGGGAGGHDPNGRDSRQGRDRNHPYSRSEQNQWGYGGQRTTQQGYQRR